MILKAVFYFRWSTIFRGCDGLPGVPAGEGAQAGEQTGRPECHCSLTGESNSPKEKSFWVYQNLKDKMQKAYTSFSVFFCSVHKQVFTQKQKFLLGLYRKQKLSLPY